MLSNNADWEEFLSRDNLFLAWSRVLRSKHFQNKDRIGLREFGTNVDLQIDHLINSLREDVYEPSACEKVYLPKKSGTVRGLPVLSAVDRVVYQGIVNVITARTQTELESIVKGHVFAHLPNNRSNPFFLRRWDSQWDSFVAEFRKLTAKGSNWLIEADIASFYDAIDHVLLTDFLHERFAIESKLLELLRQCLHAWSSHEDGKNFARGLPQGYEASDYLSTVFLLPADEYLISNRDYIRYVDDISILAPDKDSAIFALVSLDLQLKKQALILQPNKTGARKIEDVEQEIRKKFFIVSRPDQHPTRDFPTTPDTERRLLNAWRNAIRDKSAEQEIMYLLNRSSGSETGRNIALQLLPEMPWRSNVFASYLSQFKGDEVVIKALINEIATHKPYAWHLANCLRALAMVSPPDVFRNISLDWIEKVDLKWYQRLAAVESLYSDESSYGFLFARFRKEKHYLIRRSILVGLVFGAKTNEEIAMYIRYGLQDQNPEVFRAALWLLEEFPFCGITQDEVSSFATRYKVSVMSVMSGGANVSYIESVLEKLFGVVFPNKFDFRKVLNSAYDEAAFHLRQASRYINADSTAFVTYLDNFNQVLAIRLNEEILKKISIPKDEYANLLGALKSSTFGVIGVHFLECHKLRSRSRGAHAWATSLGNWTRDVPPKERDNLLKGLKPAYQQFVDVFASHFGWN